MASNAVVFIGGFLAGSAAGVVGFLLYMRYRTRKQLQQMEDQMGAMFDLEEGETDEFQEL